MFKINFQKFFRPKNNKILILNLFQLFFYILSIFGLFFYVKNVLGKYFFDPDIGISESYLQVHEIPFPAITICSPVVIKNELVNLKNISMMHDSNIFPNLTISEQNFLFAKAQLCSINNFEFFNKVSRNRTESNVVKLLKQGAPSVMKTFDFCVINYKIVPCFFTRTITDNGLCYTFNMQSFDSIFNEGVLSSDFDISREIKVSKKFRNLI